MRRPHPMPTTTASCPGWLSLPTGLLAMGQALAFTVATGTELHLSGDLDGDGRADVVLVDRGSGAVRVGYQTAPGTYAWAEGRPSGIQGVTAADIGRLLGGTHDVLAVTGPDANRVNVVDVPGPAAVPGITPAFGTPSALGPTELAIVDIPSFGLPANDDLVLFSGQGSAPIALELDRLRHTGGGAFAAELVVGLPVAPERMQSVRLATSDAPRLGALFRGGGTDVFRVWEPGQSPLALSQTVSVPGGGDHAHGRFTTAHDRNHFLFFRPGHSEFRSVPVGLSPANTLVLGGGSVIDLGRPIRSLVVVPTSPARLLVSFEDAVDAVLYRFDGASAPQAVQKVLPAEGQRVTGMVATPDGGVMVYGGPEASGPSGSFQWLAFDGTKHVLKAAGSLPPVNAAAVAANVFLFAGEPFVAAQPRLVRTLNAADWSSKPDVSGASVKVQAERFGGVSSGLGSATPRDLGPKPASVTHALPNQYARPISVASFQPALGDTVVDLVLNPPPGPQAGAINVTLTALTPGATVGWRTSPGAAWAFAPGTAIFPLHQDSTVEYFGRLGAAKSQVHRATYRFPGLPATQDSDGDGVPDFVELAKGLDPRGGSDSDGDGYTDKEELLGGSNPLDVNSPPTNAPIARLEENAAFTLFATPRPWDGFTPGEVPAVQGQEVHLHRLDGSFVGTSATAPYPGAALNPAARFGDAPADTTLALLSVSTDSHFAIATAGGDPRVGRELLGLVVVPALSPPAIPFAPADAPLSGQAGAWIAAAKAALSAVAMPTVQARFGVQETLSALLLERKTEQVLSGRGLSFPPTNRLSLFPFRRSDVTRQAVPLRALAALESLGPGASPAWRLGSMLEQVRTRLSAPEAEALPALAEDVYRTSSRSNNTAPGRFPLPVDVLRGFLDTGSLHSNYLAATALTPGRMAEAFAAAQALLAGVKPRPTNGFDLEVTGDSFQPGCTTLKQVGVATTWNLFTAPGVPFKFPDAFQLLPGSRLRVLAFTDFVDPCPGSDLQVIAASLVAIPAPTLADSDGDLLPDDWECAFLGGVGNNALEDFDGDGVSNLQEYLDGTDPRDGKSAGAVVVNLAPPVITLEGDGVGGGGAGALKLKWSFPAEYAGHFDFRVQTSTALQDGFVGESLAPVYLGGGRFELDLDTSVPARFFLLQRLKAPSFGSQSARRFPR